MKHIQKLAEWLFARDFLNILIISVFAWCAQVFSTSFFGQISAPPIGMGYIPKAFASIGVASILIFGSWFSFKLIMGICSDYFSIDFKADIKRIRECQSPSLEMFYRPAFFLLLYFAFIAVVITAAQAKLY